MEKRKLKIVYICDDCKKEFQHINDLTMCALCNWQICDNCYRHINLSISQHDNYGHDSIDTYTCFECSQKIEETILKAYPELKENE